MNSEPTNPNDNRQERNRRPDEQPVQPVLPGLEKYVTAPDHQETADQTELVQDSERGRTKPPVQAKRTERANRYKDEDDEDADDYDDDDDRPKRSKRSKSSQVSPADTGPPFTFTAEGLKTFFIQYWESARSVCIAPVPFYEAMPRKGGYRKPATFLAVGACGHALIHFPWHPDLLAFFADIAFTMCLFLLLSGGIVALLKKFERQSDMEEVFRVLAYASPLLIPMGFQWLEIIGLIYMGVLWFLGLKTLYDK